MGIEPTTRSLGSYCSTTELHPPVTTLRSRSRMPRKERNAIRPLAKVNAEGLAVNNRPLVNVLELET